MILNKVFFTRNLPVDAVQLVLCVETKCGKHTLEEDKEICENNQAGVNSRYYRPGPYSTAEETVDRFCQWYLEELGTNPRQ